MTKNQMQRLHEKLAFAFSLYAANHVDWELLDELPKGALLVFQTQDPAFNAFELRGAVRSRSTDAEPDRPITLIYVGIPRSSELEGVNWDQARVLASFAIKAQYKELVESF